MSTITRERVFILLRVIKRLEDKRPEGRTELAKLKAISQDIGLYIAKRSKHIHLSLQKPL